MFPRSIKILRDSEIVLHNFNLVDRDVNQNEIIGDYLFAVEASVGDILSIDFKLGTVKYIDPAFLISFKTEILKIINSHPDMDRYESLESIRFKFSKFKITKPHNIKSGRLLSLKYLLNTHREDWPPEWQIREINSHILNHLKPLIASRLEIIISDFFLKTTNEVISSLDVKELLEPALKTLSKGSSKIRVVAFDLRKMTRDKTDGLMRDLHDFLVRKELLKVNLDHIKALFNPDSSLKTPLDWLGTKEKLAILISKLPVNDSAPYVVAAQRFTVKGEPIEAGNLRGNNRPEKSTNLDYSRALDELFKDYM